MAGFSGPTLGAVKTWTSQEIDKAVVGSSTPKGSWNASTNTPTITDGTGANGDYYDVVVAGTFGGTEYAIGDVIKCDSNKHCSLRLKWGFLSTT